MAATARGFRYPASTAAPNVPLDIQNLATDVDGMYITTSPRPAASKPGREHYNATTGEISLDLGTAWVTKGWVDSVPSLQLIPVGSVILFAGTAAPTKYLFCQGNVLLRSAYPALFAAIGTSYNVVSDSDATQFRLPDMRGRSAIGSGQGIGLTTRTHGAKYGEEAHALSRAEIPSLSLDGFDQDFPPSASSNLVARLGRFVTNWRVGTGGAGANTVNTDSGNTGTAHNVVHPVQAINFAIRALP